MAKYPRDQFDDVTTESGRVGAHRAPALPGRAWITVAWAALVTGVLVVAGGFGLGLLRDTSFLGGDDSASTPAPIVTAEPLTDPTALDPARNITITVLNGTPTVDLEVAAGDQLTAAGWPVGTTGDASETTVTTTTVYYSNPADEDVARGILLALGAGDVVESNAFLGAPITVVLGADYTPAATPAV